MSDIKYAFLMIYNAVVVVAAAMSVYYISGWMILLILAVMRPEVINIPGEQSEVRIHSILAKNKTEESN